MTEWKSLSPTELGAAVSDNSQKDVFQFFVDKDLGQKTGQPFSKQMPDAAGSQVSAPTTADGVGAAASFNGSVSNLQMWQMVDHADVNRATPKEFGYFMDGTTTPASISWAANEPSSDRHYVQEDKAGKSKTASRGQKYSCITCRRGSEVYVVKGSFSFEQAKNECRKNGGDLPKRTATAQDTNKSYDLCTTGDFQSPQYLQRENFTRQQDKDCKLAVVSCVA